MSPRKSYKESSAPMPAASNIDNESEKAPPGMSRNGTRGVARKMTFGTGAKNSKGLSIDVDEVGEEDLYEHNTITRSQTSGVMKQPARTGLQLSARATPRAGVPAQSGIRGGGGSSSSTAEISGGHKTTPVVSKHKKTTSINSLNNSMSSTSTRVKKTI